MRKESKAFSIPALRALRAELMRTAAAEVDGVDKRRVRPLVVTLAAAIFVVTAISTFAAVRWLSGRPAERPTASASGEDDAAASPSPAASPTPGAPPFAAHGPAYTTLKELITNSDLILIGVVQETATAEVHSEGPGDEFPTRMLHTTVAVEDVLKGSDRDGKVIVPTDELAFRGPDIEDWRKAGHRVLLFLTPSPESPERHILANLNFLQTAYFVRGKEINMTVGGDIYGLSERIGRMSVEEMKKAVAASPNN